MQRNVGLNQLNIWIVKNILFTPTPKVRPMNVFSLEKKKTTVIKHVFIVHRGLRYKKMNVCSFVSRWNRFELLIATFRLQYCESSSGDEIYCLRAANCSMLVRCYWCISILIIIPSVRCCSLIGPLCG